MVLPFEHFSRLVVEAEPVLGDVGNCVLVVHYAVRALEFRGDEVCKGLVTNARLAEVDRCCADSNRTKLHLGDKGQSGTKTVTSRLHLVSWVQVSKSIDFCKHAGPDSFGCGKEPRVDLAVAIREGGVWRFGGAQVGNPVLDIHRAAESHVDRRVGGKVAYKSFSVVGRSTVYHICGLEAAQIS